MVYPCGDQCDPGAAAKMIATAARHLGDDLTEPIVDSKLKSGCADACGRKPAILEPVLQFLAQGLDRLP